MGFNYLQTDDRDDYFAQFGDTKPRIHPTFKIIKDGVVIHPEINGRAATIWAKDEMGSTSKFVKKGRWKHLLTDNGYIVENLKTGQIGPDPNDHGYCSCGQRWTVRINSKDQSKFLGCKSYPKCRNTKKLNPA